MQKNKGISPHVKDILGTVIYWRPRKEWGRIQVLIYGNFLFWRGEKKVKIVGCSVILTLCEPMDCIACQAPLSVGFSHQEYWSRLPCPSLGDLSDPGIEPGSPTLQADSLSSEPPDLPLWRGDLAQKQDIHSERGFERQVLSGPLGSFLTKLFWNGLAVQRWKFGSSSC